MSTDDVGLREENRKLLQLNRQHRAISEDHEAKVRALQQQLEGVRALHEKLCSALRRLKEDPSTKWEDVEALLVQTRRRLAS